MDINFYHLTSSPLEKTLPRLLEKVLAANFRAVVLVDSEERVEALDSMLWTYSSLAFLPHGTAKEGEPLFQPIWLTTHLENPNRAQVVIVTEGSEIKEEPGFKKCIDLFNGLDAEALASTRQRWKAYKEKGYAITYWQQDERGNWSNNAPQKNMQ